MRKPYPSIRVFERDWMEATTHVHPITPLIVWLPVIAWLIIHSIGTNDLSVFEVLAFGLIGLFVWSFVEYVLHRFIFHLDGPGALIKRLHFIIHGLHHDDPNDPTRLVMPPIASIPIALVLYFSFRPLLGEVYVEPFFAFFLVGYLCYDYTHYAVHHFRPRTRWGKFVKNSHMQHHYVAPNSRWGVSSPLWDYVFGTMGERKTEEPETI